MTGIDLVIIIIFVVSILVGVMRGFIRESLSIASWILAIWLALTFSTQAGDFIGSYFTIPAAGFRAGAGFAVVFIGTLFVFSVISWVITKILVKGPIKGTDRVLGIGFGAVRAAAIVVAIMLVLRGLGMANSEWWQQSSGIAYLEPLANHVEKMLPEQLQSGPAVSEQQGSIESGESGEEQSNDVQPGSG